MEKYSFEEFKLFYETTEKVTDRRLSMNKFNYYVCITMLTALALTWKWTIGNEKYHFIGMALIVLFSGFAFAFSIYWYLFIVDQKNLNTAKFRVLNQMAKKLHFGPTNDYIDIVSCEPFQKEWDILKGLKEKNIKEKEVLVKVGKKPLIATFSEKVLPVAFSFTTLLIFVASLLSILLNCSKFWCQVKIVLQL